MQRRDGPTCQIFFYPHRRPLSLPPLSLSFSSPTPPAGTPPPLLRPPAGAPPPPAPFSSLPPCGRLAGDAHAGRRQSSPRLDADARAGRRPSSPRLACPQVVGLLRHPSPAHPSPELRPSHARAPSVANPGGTRARRSPVAVSNPPPSIRPVQPPLSLLHPSSSAARRRGGHGPRRPSSSDAGRIQEPLLLAAPSAGRIQEPLPCLARLGSGPWRGRARRPPPAAMAGRPRRVQAAMAGWSRLRGAARPPPLGPGWARGPWSSPPPPRPRRGGAGAQPSARARSAGSTTAHLLTASSPRRPPPRRPQVRRPGSGGHASTGGGSDPGSSSTRVRATVAGPVGGLDGSGRHRLLPPPSGRGGGARAPPAAAGLELVRGRSRGGGARARAAESREQSAALAVAAQTALLPPPPPLSSLLPPPSPAWGHGGPRGETAATSAHGARRPRRSAAAASVRATIPAPPWPPAALARRGSEQGRAGDGDEAGMVALPRASMAGLGWRPCSFDVDRRRGRWRLLPVRATARRQGGWAGRR